MAAAAATAVVLGSGCARNAEEDVVEVWTMGSEGEVVETMLPAFAERHPQVPVRVQRLPWSAAHEKLLTAYVGRTMPDVFQIGNTWIPEMVALGALEPLDERASESSSVAPRDYFAGILDTNVVDGRLHALPWYVDTRLLFYRRDLLTRAGVAATPATWPQWLEAMRAVRERAGENGYAIFLPVDEWQTPVILALQHGARLLRDDDSFGNFRSAEMKAAMTLYLSLYENDFAPQRAAAQIANLYQEFAAGYFAIFITGPWNLRELARRLPADLATAWTTSPMPGMGSGLAIEHSHAAHRQASPAESATTPGVSLAGGASLAIASSSKRKDAAWKLLEFLAEPAQQAAFYRASGSLPARRSTWNDAALADDETAHAFRVQLEHVVPTPKIPEWERIASKVSLHVERMVRGDVTLEQGLADLDADVDAILAKRRWLMGRMPSGTVSDMNR